MKNKANEILTSPCRYSSKPSIYLLSGGGGSCLQLWERDLAEGTASAASENIKCEYQAQRRKKKT
jgi:hypothetical protein